MNILTPANKNDITDDFTAADTFSVGNFMLKGKVHPKLPLFELRSGGQSVLYAPGKVAVVDYPNAEAICRAWSGDGVLSPGSISGQTARWLETHAENALKKWKAVTGMPFQPECLTIYPGIQCNLKCGYCYARNRDVDETAGSRSGRPVMADSVVASAAAIVAKNCADKGLPFHLVLHGGGEPSYYFDQVRRYTAITRQAARQLGLDWFGYIATNGVMPEKNARWLAENFTRIGLSCDGPPDIQDRQRPLKTGGRTSPQVKQTARILTEHGADMVVRATLTPWSFSRQTEIVTYFYEHLNPSAIRFEPAFRLRDNGHPGFTADDASIFVEHFLAARKTAESMGCHLSLSGIRPEEIHGPFCDVLRNVLRLGPDGSATACFLISDETVPVSSPFLIGRADPDTGDFILDTKKIEAFRRSVAVIPAECEQCINICHCARGCPDRCPVLTGSPVDPENKNNNNFLCRLYQKLAPALIMDAADRLINREQKKAVTILPDIGISDEAGLNLNDLPAAVNREEIRKQYDAVGGTYDITAGRLPEPAWRKKGFTFNGPDAWHYLRRVLPDTDHARPVSIYFHVPFCEHRCAFCDCYAFPFGKKRSVKEEAFCRALVAEMRFWSDIYPISRRRVTTVHFGGGTPGCLNAPVFDRILTECRDLFKVHEQTEWALETTVSHIRQEDLNRLGKLGFSRLHVGVQTLNEDLRQSIGRRTSAKDAVFRLKKAMGAGFVVSVDILYGLPGQRLSDVLNTLSILIDMEIHGLSLYRFNVSKRNRWYIKRCREFNPDPRRDYLMFQAAEQMLTKAGYRKNHFAHFAKQADRNLYFTCPLRGEDLLAMGPTADGFFGNYRYRNAEYARYMNQLQNKSGMPVLQGCLEESDLEVRARPAILDIMGSHIRRSVHEHLGIDSLIKKWEDCLLIENLSGGNDFALTPNGSWFVNQMIADVLHDLESR